MSDEQAALIEAHALPCPGCQGKPKLYEMGLGPAPEFRFRLCLGCWDCRRRGPQVLVDAPDGLGVAQVTLAWNRLIREVTQQPAFNEMACASGSGRGFVAPFVPGTRAATKQNRGGRRQSMKPQMPARYARPANAKGWRKRAR